MTCGDRTIFAEEVHDCLCEYDVRTFLIEDLELGATEGTKTCQAPDAGDVDFCKGDDSWMGPNKDEKGKRRDIYECQRCPLEGQIYDTDSDPYQCICSNNLNYLTAGDICLKEDEIDDIDDYKEDKAVEIQYESIESINSSGGYQIGDGEVDSGTFKYYYLKAAVGCKTKKNPKDCQTLANLCVLTFYDTEAQACVLYNELIEEQEDEGDDEEFEHLREAYPDKGFQQGLPWLYYDKKRNGKDIIEEAARVKFRASFDIDKPEIGLLTTLKFVLAKYDIEGEFLGFEEMTDQLVICEKPMEEVQRIYRIGTSVKIECTYDLANLISENKFDRPRQQNIFYELFLVDWDGTPNGRLVDVPILMTNMVDSSFGTTAPNTENDEERWLLTRRFFLFDTISGID